MPQNATRARNPVPSIPSPSSSDSSSETSGEDESHQTSGDSTESKTFYFYSQNRRGQRIDEGQELDIALDHASQTNRALLVFTETRHTNNNMDFKRHDDWHIFYTDSSTEINLERFLQMRHPHEVAICNNPAAHPSANLSSAQAILVAATAKFKASPTKYTANGIICCVAKAYFPTAQQKSRSTNHLQIEITSNQANTLSTWKKPVQIFAIYGPSQGHKPSNQFYKDILDPILTSLPDNTPAFLLGDFNAHVNPYAIDSPRLAQTKSS